MIPALILLTLFAQNTETNKAVYIVEEVRLEMPNALPEIVERHVYLSLDKSKRVRVDLPGENKRLIYDLQLRMFIIADMPNKTYYLARSGRDRDIVRSPLRGITFQEDEFVFIKDPVVTATGRRQIISGEDCQEYRLNLPSRYKLKVSIWTTKTAWLKDKEIVKNMWFAALGAKPPSDVRTVISRLKNSVKGMPIRISSTIEEAGFKIITSSTIKSIDRTYKVDDDFFEIPKNFEIAKAKNLINSP